jgi:methionyl-tRNA formyltransferase
MRTVFLGTGEIGLPTLRFLVGTPLCELVGVVTGPDRRVGRGRELRRGPIARLADEAGIPVQQPERLRHPDAVADLAAWRADLFVVMAYGQILSPEVLALPRVAAWNLHASLLPRHRGASPIQAALLAGDTTTGITVMFIAQGLDTGDICHQKAIPISPIETAGSLHDKLGELAPLALAEALPLLQKNPVPRFPQDEALATYAPKIEKAAGRIDWHLPASEIECRIRAFFPWPGSFSTLQTGQGSRHLCKVLRACLPSSPPQITLSPGELWAGESGELLVGTGENGLLQLEQLQTEGRSATDAAAWWRGWTNHGGGSFVTTL